MFALFGFRGRMLLSATLLATPFLLTATLLASPPGATVPAKTQAVAIKGFAFVPQTIVVAPGTIVTWTNVDEDPHTATATDKSFHSPALDQKQTFSFTFTKAGEFAYFCQLHPHMTGKVIVKG